MAPGWPLVLKEIRTVARDPRTFVLRSAFAAVAIPIVASIWDATRFRPASSVSELAQTGRTLFHWVVATQVLFSLLAAAALGSASVTDELRKGTLPLLLLAELDGRRIIRAKWLSSALQGLNILLCGAPLLASAAFLGAAGALDVAAAAALAVAAAAVGAAYGVDASARTPAGASALLRAFGGLLVYGGAAWGFSVMTLGFGAWGLPFVHVYAALPVFLLPAIGVFPTEIYPFTTLAASLAFAGWRIRRSERTVAAAVRRPPPPRAEPRDLVGLDALYRRRGRRRGVWEDAPILWKELATRPVARLSMFGRLFGLVGLGALVLAGLFQAALHEMGYFLFLWTLYLGMAATAGALLFETERAQNQWETLLTTPLSRGRFFREKLAAGLLGPEALCAAALAAVTAVGWGLLGGPTAALCLTLTTASFLGLAYLAGAVASLTARSLPVAWSIAAVGVSAFVWGLDRVDEAFWSHLSPWALMKHILLSQRANESPLPRVATAHAAYAALAAALYALALRRLRNGPGRA